MGKKILLAVFGGIVAVGLLVCLVGFAMGGRGGSIRVRDNDLVFQNSRETVRLGNAPGWMKGWPYSWRYTGFYDDYTDYDDYDDDFDDYDDYDAYDDYDDFDDSYYGKGQHGYGKHQPSGSTADLAAPAEASRIHKLDVDIAAGIVEVRTGAEPRLEVTGPLNYNTWFEDDTWHIESLHHGDLVWRNAACWLGGQDMTTRFVITMPDTLTTLEVNIGAGEAQVAGFNTGELDLSVDAGSLRVQDCTANEGDLDVNAGELKTQNVTLSQCDLECAAGSIKFDGEVTGELDATVSAGDIKITVPRPASYSWQSEANMGSIKVDGKNVSEGIHTSSSGGTAGALPVFDLECNMGSINVSFK